MPVVPGLDLLDELGVVAVPTDITDEVARALLGMLGAVLRSPVAVVGSVASATA
jgi:hypothetical protein